MPKRRPAVTSVGVSRHLRDTWRREHAERPAAAQSASVAGIMLLASLVLAATQLDLLAELIAGLAVLPLSFAVFLRLLPAPPWSDDADDSAGPGRGGDDHYGPRSPGGPRLNIDWDRFEQQFRAYAAQHIPAHPTPE